MSVEFNGQSGVSLKAMPHYLVQSSGTGNGTTGGTSQTFLHGLGKIPDFVSLSTLANTIAWTISSITATQIVVNVANAQAFELLALVED